jgi:hypothetical protein
VDIMNLFCVVGVIGSVFSASAALAQTASPFAAGWRKVEGEKPSYVNAATLMTCPETLSDGYRLFRADVYASSTDVSCGYKLSDDTGLISFYFYPAIGSIQDEITSTSQPILDRFGPRSAQRESQRDWALPTGVIKATALEITSSEGVSQSFAIADIAGRRMKARETWQGAPEASHRAADSFLALQTDALANARACAAMRAWRTGRKARLSGDPFVASMTAGVLLGTLMPNLAATQTDAPKPCVLGSLGRSDRGSTLVLSRNGAEGVQIALDDQPDGNLIAGLANVSISASLQLPGDSQYVLYSREGAETSIFRAYRTMPSWDQVRADMISVATNSLDPLVRVRPKDTGAGSNVSINTTAVDAEKAKTRPGSQ